MYEIIKDSKVVWDESKERIFNQVEPSTFNIWNTKIDDLLNGEWWYVRNTDKKICGYGWVNQEYGDFEISLVVDENFQGKGIGEQLLKYIEQIARDRAISEVTGTVQPENPNIEKMIKWMYKRGYSLNFAGQLKSEQFAINISLRKDIPLEMIKYIN